MRKALFWDFDGTLVHANESFLKTLDAGLCSCGHKIPADKLRTFLKSACSWYVFDEVYPDKTGSGWWDTLLEKLYTFCSDQGISPDDCARICRYFREHIPKRENYTLYDDAKDTLARCISMGYVNHIVSNNYPELPEVVKAFGLAPYFQHYIVSSNLGYEKPRPEIFRYALTLAENPEIAYMIGDNPVADIQGAHAVGMKTILVHHEDRFTEDYNCRTLREIPEFLL